MPSAIDYRDFWSVAVEDVPRKTGAEPMMDCADIRDVLDHLAVDLSAKRVLDVGCGTGRLASLCSSWVGVDVSPAAVAYCRDRGLRAEPIGGPLDLLELGNFDTVCCLSVFTHISRDDQRAYLPYLRRATAELVVDILPGPDDTGGIAAWFTEPAEFECDLAHDGFDIVDAYERVSLDGATHLYYLAR